MNHLSSLRILIVEDHRDTRLAITLYLQELGHSVISASSLREGVSKTSEGHWDMILTDLNLPDGSGQELLERAKIPAETLVVTMSAKSLGVGTRPHLFKPFKPEELDALLESAPRHS